MVSKRESRELRPKTILFFFLIATILRAVKPKYLKEAQLANNEKIFRPLFVSKDTVFEEEINSENLISRNSDFIITLENSLTFIPLETDEMFDLLINVVNRGSADILAFLTVEDTTQVQVLDVKTLSFNAYDFDKEASDSMGNLFVLKKDFPQQGYLGIIQIQPKGEIGRTTFKIEAKNISESGCQHNCNNGGKCEEGSCMCSYNYLGRQCGVRTFTKEEDKFETSYLLGKNEVFHFFENVTQGSKEYKVLIEDSGKSKIGVIWNQFSEATDKLHMRRFTRGLKTDTQMKMLDQIISSGSQELEFKAVVNYVYFSLINYEHRTTTVKIKIERIVSFEESTAKSKNDLLTALLSIGSFILFSFLAFYIKGRRTLARTETPRSFADSGVSNDEEQNSQYRTSLNEIPASSRPLVERRNRVSPTLTMMFNLGEVEQYFPKVENIMAICRKDKIKKKCSLCMLDLANGLPVRKVIVCGDYFHAKCLMDHLDSSNTCPDCRFLLTKNNLDSRIKELLRKEKQIKEDSERKEKKKIQKKNNYISKKIKKKEFDNSMLTPSRSRCSRSKRHKSKSRKSSIKSHKSKEKNQKKKSSAKFGSSKIHPKRSRRGSRINSARSRMRGKDRGVKSSKAVKKSKRKKGHGLRINIDQSILEEEAPSLIKNDNIFKITRNSAFDSVLSIENAIKETKPIKFAYKLDNFNSMNILNDHKLRESGSKSINMRKKARRHSKSRFSNIHKKRNSAVKMREETSPCGMSVGIFKRTDGFHFYTPKQKREREEELKKNIEDIIFRRNNKRHGTKFSEKNKEESKTPPKVSKSRRGSSNRVSMKTIDSNMLSPKSSSIVNDASSFHGSILSRNRKTKKSFFGQKSKKIRNKTQPKVMKVKNVPSRSKKYKGSRFRQMAEVKSVKVKSCRNVSSNLDNVN